MRRITSRVGWWRRTGFIAAAGAVLLPAVTGGTSLPLSDYPIYAQARPRTSTLATARGVDAGGRWVTLGAEVIAETDDPLVAQSRLEAGVRGDAETYCRAVARRAAPPSTFVELALEEHDLVAGARDEPSLRRREVVARCPVPG